MGILLRRLAREVHPVDGGIGYVRAPTRAFGLQYADMYSWCQVRRPVSAFPGRSVFLHRGILDVSLGNRLGAYHLG